jgi:tight adherence protein C
LAYRLLMNDEEERHRLQQALLNAGIYSPIALPLFLGTKLLLIAGPPIAGAVAGVCGWLNPHAGLLYGSLIGGVGLILPSLWLRSQKRRWHTIISKSLPDFLDLMVACLEAGLSAEAALQRVTEELRLAHPRLSAELSVVQAQIDLGASSDVALKSFADRSDHESIRAIANIIQQARRLGGGIAEAFRQQAESLRIRREHAAEEKAQQAAVKILLPTLFLIFPSIFVVLAGPAVIQLAEKFGNDPAAASSMTSGNQR